MELISFFGAGRGLLFAITFLECCSPIRFTKQGKDAMARQTAYQKLFCFELDSGLLNEIRQAINGGYVFGNDKFQREMPILS